MVDSDSKLKEYFNCHISNIEPNFFMKPFEIINDCDILTFLEKVEQLTNSQAFGTFCPRSLTE